MKQLDDEKISYEVKWAPALPKNPDLLKPEGLFWSTDWCQEQWALYPYVQLYDNTYRTNSKGLAFFQVVALNHMGIAVSCAFGLINNERKVGFDWLMQQVDALRNKIKARPHIDALTPLPSPPVPSPQPRIITITTLLPRDTTHAKLG